MIKLEPRIQNFMDINVRKDRLSFRLFSLETEKAHLKNMLPPDPTEGEEESLKRRMDRNIIEEQIRHADDQMSEITKELEQVYTSLYDFTKKRM